MKIRIVPLTWLLLSYLCASKDYLFAQRYVLPVILLSLCLCISYDFVWETLYTLNMVQEHSDMLFLFNPTSIYVQLFVCLHL